jgi:Putative Flp pilus-assembly TadE/G-like
MRTWSTPMGQIASQRMATGLLPNEGSTVWPTGDDRATAGPRAGARPGIGPVTGQSSSDHGQRGSASLIGLALCAFVAIATLVTADVGALAFARARAQTAADLAALAAVTPYPGAAGPGGPASPNGLGSPTERTQVVATSNGAEVVTCSCGSLDTTVGVRVRAQLIPFGATVGVRAYARAVLPLAMDPASLQPEAGHAAAGDR